MMKLLNVLNEHPFVYWIPVLFVAGVILFFSLVSDPVGAFAAIGVSKRYLDFNILHVMSYFALSMLLSITFIHSRNNLLKSFPYTLSLFFCIFFGGIIELAQDFIPHRHLSFIDFVYNLIGIFSAQLLVFFFGIVYRTFKK